MHGKALPNAAAERIADDADRPLDFQRGQEIAHRIRVVLALGDVLHEAVREHVARRVPGNHAVAVGQARKLMPPMHRVGADTVQEKHRGRIGPTRLEIAEPVALIIRPRGGRDFRKLDIRQRRDFGFHLRSTWHCERECGGDGRGRKTKTKTKTSTHLEPPRIDGAA
jgi:hypothetical protein